jgi:hypothetical protein
MTTLQRKACPRCQRVVAWRVIRGPRVNRGRPIPALTQPVPHKREILSENGWFLGDWCVPTKAPRP